MRKNHKKTILFLTYSLVFTVVSAQEKQNQLPPDYRNEKYGAHERNVFDLWKAKSDKPTPLVIYMHAGGFRGHSKAEVLGQEGLIQRCLEAGISVASINYRLTDTALYPAQMQDGARAVQYLRLKARDFNLDPKRFATTGRSAGAGMSLWLAFHDDLADEKAEDPVLRQSTRPNCIIAGDGQSSYDPRWIKKNIGERTPEHISLQKFFGVTLEELQTDKAAKLYEDASAINHLTKDDSCPVMLYYSGADEPNGKPGVGMHSKKFGEILKAEMEKLGLSCELLIVGRSSGIDDRMKFFLKHLTPKADSPTAEASGKHQEASGPALEGLLPKSRFLDFRSK